MKEDQGKPKHPKNWRTLAVYGYYYKQFFRTVTETNGKLLTGGIGDNVLARIELPASTKLCGFVAPKNGDFEMRVTDSHKRRWQPEADHLPLDAWADYPGYGHHRKGKIQRRLDDRQKSTRMSLEISKLVAPQAELNLAVSSVENWITERFSYPDKLESPDWWLHFNKHKVYYQDVVDVVLGAGATGDTFVTNVPGDTIITSISYTGGAEIKALLSYGGNNTGSFLSNKPIRIDLLGACHGLPGNVQNGYEWDGAHFIDAGDELSIEVESLNGGLALNEQISIEGFFLPESFDAARE